MGSGDGSMGIWKDRLFWSLFLGGLASYLLGFEFTWAFPLGSFLWLSAFVYLTVRFIQKNFGKPPTKTGF
jgi:hypothetical protein